jgi:hypothetical protein
LASDVAHTTRSVVNGSRTAADAGTTTGHHLATSVHEIEEYLFACGKVKYLFPTNNRCSKSKKVINYFAPKQAPQLGASG